MPADPGPRPHHWWQALVRRPDGVPERLLVVGSTEQPDGTRVEVSTEDAARIPAGEVVCTASFGGPAVSALRVSREFAPRLPSVWFVEIVEAEAQPPATNLLAFGGADQEPGTLVSDADVNALSVVSDDQLGALRWYPATGEVDQIYVAPAWRRQQVATGLLAAAATLSVARDWPRLWTDGQRTELGEHLSRSRSWRDRAAELTHVAPPMTPPD